MKQHMYVKFEVIFIRFLKFVMNSIDPRSMEGLEIAKKSKICLKNLLMFWLFELIEISVWNILVESCVFKKYQKILKMTSDFGSSVSLGFIWNFHVKPNSKHTGCCCWDRNQMWFWAGFLAMAYEQQMPLFSPTDWHDTCRLCSLVWIFQSENSLSHWNLSFKITKENLFSFMNWG